MDTRIFLILTVYSVLTFVLTYYFNMFISKNDNSSPDINNILPQLGDMLKKITSNYSIFRLISIILISAFIAIIILTIFTNWVINSAIIPLIIFFTGPKLAVYFDETRVTISNNFTDIFETIYTTYYRYIMAGFLAGFGTKLIDNWINVGAVSFTWFLLNFLINTVLIMFILKEDIFEQ